MSRLILPVWIALVFFPTLIRADVRECKVYVSVGSGTLDSGQQTRLQSRIRQDSKHDVSLAHGRQEAPSIQSAIAAQANFLLELTSTSRDAGGYIIAVLKKIPSTELIGDTAFGDSDGKEAIDHLAKWYAEKVGPVPCETYSSDTALSKLETKPSAAPSNWDGRTTIHVKFDSVPARFQEPFLVGVEKSGLELEVSRLTDKMSQLILSCTSDCATSRLALKIPYAPTVYASRRGQSKDPLSPLLSVASGLIKFRNSLNPPIHGSNLLLIIQDVSGASLEIVLSGTVQKPKMKPKENLDSFFAVQ